MLSDVVTAGCRDARGTFEHQSSGGVVAMNIHEVIQQSQDAITVRRVFGEPYEKDGITVIPAAKVGGA
jgi:uncharacterized spore protein YtfJ